MISLREVSKTYQAGVPAVDRISLDVAAGETVVLVGASGCGKTTTLKMINRLVEPSAGEIHVDGQNTADADPVSLRRSIGYVFQGIGLFPHWTVADNVAAIPRLLGWPESRVRERIDELLTRVGLPADTYRERRPFELSGGQQQRVGVARALAAEAKVLLMDEPFGAVDPVTRDGLQQELGIAPRGSHCRNGSRADPSGRTTRRALRRPRGRGRRTTARHASSPVGEAP